MAEIEINDLASWGQVRDIRPYMLPPEAFSVGRNVRFYNQGVERIGGRTQVFGTPLTPPHYAIPVQSTAQTFWIYVGLTKAYVWNGSTHTNITRQTAGSDVNYTVTNGRDWQGTLLGGIPIINNGVDLPQYWPTLTIGTKLANLANFPASMRAKIIRAFGPNLMAFNITDGSTVFPHLVRWSHPADPGSVPISWDVTDGSKDAGQTDLTDTEAGFILDALPLAEKMFIYKEGSVWKCTRIGGRFIFDFKAFLETAGLLAARCLTISGDGKVHVFATQDDILMHNGVKVESILAGRDKKTLFNSIDSLSYQNSFMFANPRYDEVWFCFPENGATFPTRALVWNYGASERGSLSDVEIDFRYATAGVVEAASAETWASASGSWDSDVEPWSTNERRKVVLCNTDDTKLLQLDSGTTFDGVPILAVAAREGLSVEGRKRTGEWIVNYVSMKFTWRMWIKASGGPINVRVGFAELVDGPTTWTPTKSFDPDTQLYVDFEITGRALAVEFTSVNAFRIEGYKFEGNVVGNF